MNDRMTTGFDTRVRREIEKVLDARVTRVIHFEAQPQDPTGKGPYTPVQIKVRVTDRYIMIEAGTQQRGDPWFMTGNTHQTVEAAVAQFATLAEKHGLMRKRD